MCGLLLSCRHARFVCVCVCVCVCGWSRSTDDDHIWPVVNSVTVARSVAVNVRHWFSSERTSNGQRIPVFDVVAELANVRLRSLAVKALVESRVATDVRRRRRATAAGARRASAVGVDGQRRCRASANETSVSRVGDINRRRQCGRTKPSCRADNHGNCRMKNGLYKTRRLQI